MISFIVPAHNEETLIARTLLSIKQSIAAVSDHSYEVIVVNDASEDRTAEVAKAQGARVIDVQFRQIAATRNAGARASVGEILVFVDADTQVTQKSLLAAIEAMDGGAIGGGSLIRFDGPVPLYARLLEYVLVPLFQRIFAIAGGCFLFCTRKAFEASGGFNEELFCAEEVDFVARLKKQGRFLILSERVITSGRKTRSHSAFGLIWIGLRLAISGRKAFRRREGLDFWYGERQRSQS